MASEFHNAVQSALEQKRVNLYHWLEATPEEKRRTQLGTAAETAVKEQLHVIDDLLGKIEDGIFGVCEVCHEAVDNELLQVDYTAAVCLGHFSDEQLRQLENELELSRVVQRALLPQKIPSIAGLEISAFSRPAQIVGGDYFDFLQFKDGAHGLVIADVSGHGVSAGMLMTSLQTAFHTLVPETDSPLEVLERINRLYIHNINFTTFVTIFFSRFNLRTRTLTYANAGHNEAFLYQRAREKEVWLQPTGAAIGLMEEFKINARDIQLETSDILLLYTDGVTEAINPGREQFGRARLADVIRKNSDLPVNELIQKILQAMNEFTAGIPIEDDITLVIYKAN